MMNNAIKLKNNFLLCSLFLGLYLVPFTSLRFGFAGPGEVLILFSFLLSILTAGGVIFLDKRLQPVYLFWVLYLFFSMLGFFYNFFVLGDKSGRQFTAAFDFFSYSFILLTVIHVGHVFLYQKISAQSFFKALFFSWSITYIVLYAISFFSRSIFGMPLRYHNFFSPLVDNVHQAASVTCVMAFVMLFFFSQSKSLSSKSFFIVSAFLFGKMAIDSGSTKAFLAVLFGCLSAVLVFILYRSHGQGKLVFNIISFLLVLICIFFVAILFDEVVYRYAILFFTENDGAGARESLYTVGFNHGLESFLFGYGPGSHAPYANGFSDAHNTLLTIFLQSGVLGFFLFTAFVTKLIRKVSVNFALCAALVALGLYTLGGDVLRRLPLWIIVIGLFYLSDLQSSLRLKKN